MATDRGPNVTELLSEYWKAYGGSTELCRSPFLYIALFLLPLTYGIWSAENWWSDVLSILPNLMGISLAAFTLFLSAGSEKFRELIAGSDSDEVESGSLEPSPFLKTAAVFLHFLIVQFVAIILAFIAKALYALPVIACFSSAHDFLRPIYWGLSFFVFLYALSVVLAASFAIFEVVNWFDSFVSQKREIEAGREESKEV